MPLPMLPVMAINVVLVVVSNSISTCLECMVSYPPVGSDIDSSNVWLRGDASRVFLNGWEVPFYSKSAMVRRMSES